MAGLLMQIAMLTVFGWLLKHGVNNRKIINGCVAQLNRAFDYESKGFWFESRRGHKAPLKSGAFLFKHIEYQLLKLFFKNGMTIAVLGWPTAIVFKGYSREAGVNAKYNGVPRLADLVIIGQQHQHRWPGSSAIERLHHWSGSLNYDKFPVYRLGSRLCGCFFKDMPAGTTRS